MSEAVLRIARGFSGGIAAGCIARYGLETHSAFLILAGAALALFVAFNAQLQDQRP